MYAGTYACMHAFMCVCVCACVRPCLCTGMCVCMHAYMHARKYVCSYVCMHACMDVCMYRSLYAFEGFSCLGATEGAKLQPVRSRRGRSTRTPKTLNPKPPLKSSWGFHLSPVVYLNLPKPYFLVGSCYKP